MTVNSENVTEKTEFLLRHWLERALKEMDSGDRVLMSLIANSANGCLMLWECLHESISDEQNRAKLRAIVKQIEDLAWPV
ncbi:hypothetical protein PHACT_12745 [Pseudohongiella acticola]|uniref:Uncharacterized protein n=1 Tax=Pseudohongiella acticola TaxID=1524254 RepID=A0A1E8CG35_9GAMM|nr:hypothetical protein [Pseudohongiella acticola]OFE11418.1 hypothetical protein PHACT_12745 [Pseudohongiella acticola]